MDEKLLTPNEVKDVLHIGINQTRKLMKTPGFPSIRLNSKIYVTEDNLKKWLEDYRGKTFHF